MQRTDIVVGGGISGLLAALILAEQHGRQVLVVERENEAGGLLRCFDYGDHGVFDYGMHNMYETGISALDSLLFELLPSNEWQMLVGKKRDVAGVVFNGQMQLNSPFPDLRSLSTSHKDVCLSGFFNQLESGERVLSDNAWNEAKSRFGTPIAAIIDSALQNQFGVTAKKLAPFASKLTTLSRVILFSEPVFKELIESPSIRERLAWPEQRTLPSKWESGRTAYYPKKYGMYRVIQALLARLQKAGVNVLTGSQVNSVKVSANNISNIRILSDQGEQRIDNIESLVWTSGLPPLAKVLDLDISDYSYDLPRKTVVANFLLRKPPNMEDLYYLYCYETGCHTFRITNFSGYCAGAQRNGYWPVSVELLLDSPQPDNKEITQIAKNELVQFGVVSNMEDIIFSAVEILAGGFPMPTVNNFSVMADIRNRVFQHDLDNLTILGIQSEENVFFQRDVLAQVWTKLMGESDNNG